MRHILIQHYTLWLVVHIEIELDVIAIGIPINLIIINLKQL